MVEQSFQLTLKTQTFVILTQRDLSFVTSLNQYTLSDVVVFVVVVSVVIVFATDGHLTFISEFLLKRSRYLFGEVKCLLNCQLVTMRMVLAFEDYYAVSFIVCIFLVQ